MPITYTNRKGVTYYLCRGSTRTGKPRYTFAREPRDTPVEELPEGFRISESVNGVVSLVREAPTQLLPAEVAVVEAAVRRHPQARKYRVAVRRDRVDIYEQTGADANTLAAALRVERLRSQWPGGGTPRVPRTACPLLPGAALRAGRRR